MSDPNYTIQSPDAPEGFKKKGNIFVPETAAGGAPYTPLDSGANAPSPYEILNQTAALQPENDENKVYIPKENDSAKIFLTHKDINPTIVEGIKAKALLRGLKSAETAHDLWTYLGHRVYEMTDGNKVYLTEVENFRTKIKHAVREFFSKEYELAKALAKHGGSDEFEVEAFFKYIVSSISGFSTEEFESSLAFVDSKPEFYELITQTVGMMPRMAAQSYVINALNSFPSEEIRRAVVSAMVNREVPDFQRGLREAASDVISELPNSYRPFAIDKNVKNAKTFGEIQPLLVSSEPESLVDLLKNPPIRPVENEETLESKVDEELPKAA